MRLGAGRKEGVGVGATLHSYVRFLEAGIFFEIVKAPPWFSASGAGMLHFPKEIILFGP